MELNPGTPLSPSLPRPAVFVFVWSVVVGALAKALYAAELVDQADSYAGLAWLPLGVLTEASFALVPLLVYLALTRALSSSRHRDALALPVPVAIVMASALWHAANLVSFIVTQTGITWERLRGDEGVTFADAHLMDRADLVPAVLYGALCLLAVPVVITVVRRIPRLRAGPLWAAGAVAVACASLDVMVLRERNFGICEQPLLALLRTYVRAELVPSSPVTLSSVVVPPPTTREEMDALLASTVPAPPPPERAAPSVKNAIVFFSEGVGKKHTALGGSDATPNLAARLREGGLQLDRHYAPYHKSIAAIFSLACADYPPPSSKSITEVNPSIDCGELSQAFAAHDVRTGLFHGGDFGFYDKLALLGLRSYDVLKDRSSLRGKQAWMNEWGIDDRLVVDATLEWIDSLPRDERFVAWLIPITAHYPHAYPPDFPARFPGTAGRDRYLSAVSFLDAAFERLMDGLEARGLLEDTVVVFTADHGETIGERPRASAGRRLMYEPSVRVPMVLFNERLFPEPQQSSRMTSHIDVVPTLLDLLGLPADARHRGRSVMAAEWSSRKVLLGASNGAKYIGFVDGDRKLVVNRTSGVREVYDLKADPSELRNIADEVPAEELDRWVAEVVAVAEAHESQLRRAPKLPAVDIQREVLKRARVSYKASSSTKWTRCARGKGAERNAFTCPDGGEPVVAGRQRIRTISGRSRDCVLMNVPPAGGKVELRLDDVPFFSLLSRVRVGLQEGALPDDVVDVSVLVDDDKRNARTVDLEHPERRVSHAVPTETYRLVLRASKELSKPLCVTLTDKAWRP